MEKNTFVVNSKNKTHLKNKVFVAFLFFTIFSFAQVNTSIALFEGNTGQIDETLITSLESNINVNSEGVTRLSLSDLLNENIFKYNSSIGLTDNFENSTASNANLTHFNYDGSDYSAISSVENGELKFEFTHKATPNDNHFKVLVYTLPNTLDLSGTDNTITFKIKSTKQYPLYLQFQEENEAGVFVQVQAVFSSNLSYTADGTWQTITAPIGNIANYDAIKRVRIGINTAGTGANYLPESGVVYIDDIVFGDGSYKISNYIGVNDNFENTTNSELNLHHSNKDHFTTSLDADPDDVNNTVLKADWKAAGNSDFGSEFRYKAPGFDTYGDILDLSATSTRLSFKIKSTNNFDFIVLFVKEDDTQAGALYENEFSYTANGTWQTISIGGAENANFNDIKELKFFVQGTDDGFVYFDDITIGVPSLSVDSSAALSYYESLILPDAKTLPASLFHVVTNFMNAGGDVIFLGGKPFSNLDGDYQISGLYPFEDFQEFSLQGITNVARFDSSPFTTPVNINLNTPYNAISTAGAPEYESGFFIPLLTANNVNNQRIGWAGGAVINTNGAYKDSNWAFFNMTDNSVYGTENFGVYLSEILSSLTDNSVVNAKPTVPQVDIVERKPRTLSFLKQSADGKTLVDSNDEDVFLIGVNYIYPQNNRAFDFWNKASFSTEDLAIVENDFRKMQAAGINAVRIFFKEQMTDVPELNAALKTYAERYDIQILMEVVTHSFDETDELVVARTNKVLDGFKNDPSVFGYDIQNEPQISGIAGIRFNNNPSPLLQLDVYNQYQNSFDKARVDNLTSNYVPNTFNHPKIGAWITDETEVKNLYASHFLWRALMDDVYSPNSPTLLENYPSKIPSSAEFDPFFEALDATFDQWYSLQENAITLVSPNQLVTIGFNSGVTILPFNTKLDFTNHHTYYLAETPGQLRSYVEVQDKLREIWPNKPITMGEFGYSNGEINDGGYTTLETSTTAEFLMYLNSYAKGFSGGFKWRLNDEPIEQTYASYHWMNNSDYEQRVRQSRFGMYAFDGYKAVPKPIVNVLSFFRDYVDSYATDRGNLIINVNTDVAQINSKYKYTASNGLFIGNIVNSEDIQFTSPDGTLANLMAMWKSSELRLLSTKTMEVTFNPLDLSTDLTNEHIRLSGNYTGYTNEAGIIKVTLLEGEALTIEFDAKAIWNGNESSDWSTIGNWTPQELPTAASNVIIPSGLTNYPTIANGTNVTINSVTINSGASLIAQGTATLTGNVTYKRNLSFVSGNAEGWHLIGAPVAGQAYNDDFVLDNAIALGTGANKGIGFYNNNIASGNWSYFQAGGNGVFESGKGYSLKTSQTTDVSFTGTLNRDPINTSITIGTGTSFNLLGNPYTAFINSASFLTTNSTKLKEQTLWVWNPSTKNYDAKISGLPFGVAPGQGFFVNCEIPGDLTFEESIQSHQVEDTFLKTDPKIEITLKSFDGVYNKYTKVFYTANATKGFDNGLDGGSFEGAPINFDIFSHLLEGNEGKNYQIQSLPNTDLETMIIPIGVLSASGKTIIFSAETFNLPTGVNVYLEDRILNTFTRLDEPNTEYKITLTQHLNGVGRFYVRTTQNILSIDNTSINNITIYKTHKSTLQIVGLPQGSTELRIYDMLGKEVMQTSIVSHHNNKISLPSLPAGIFIVTLQNKEGILQKKIRLE